MQTIGEGFGSCVNPGELIKHFGRFKRLAGYPVELQNYSLIAALRARVSPVIKIVIAHLQPVPMYDQQHNEDEVSRHSLRIGPIFSKTACRRRPLSAVNVAMPSRRHRELRPVNSRVF